MNGCTHPYRGSTDNPTWSACEICGDHLRATDHPVNLTAENFDAMIAAKQQFADDMFPKEYEMNDHDEIHRDHPGPTLRRSQTTAADLLRQKNEERTVTAIYQLLVLRIIETTPELVDDSFVKAAMKGIMDPSEESFETIAKLWKALHHA